MKLLMLVVEFSLIDGCSFSPLFTKSGFQDYQVVKTKLSKVKICLSQLTINSYSCSVLDCQERT